MSGRVIRITMFKIPQKDSQQELLGLYKTLSATHEKDGKPYILSLTAGTALSLTSDPEPRSQGFTIVAKSEFKDLEDMKFYDNDCEAHKILRAGAKGLGVDGIMTVYYNGEVVAGS